VLDNALQFGIASYRSSSSLPGLCLGKLNSIELTIGITKMATVMIDTARSARSLSKNFETGASGAKWVITEADSLSPSTPMTV
jgi:hypothetical protein